MPHLDQHSTLLDLVNTVCEVVNNSTPAAYCDVNAKPVSNETFRRMLDALIGKVNEVEQATYTMGENMSKIATVLEKLLAGDDEKLMDRLQAKVKANYTEQQDVLTELVAWLDIEKKMFPEAGCPINAEGIVQKFLEEKSGE